MCSIATIIYIQHDVFYGIFSNFIFFAEKSRILTKFKQKTLLFLEIYPKNSICCYMNFQKCKIFVNFSQNLLANPAA